jgi:hypothetical protein
MLDDAKRHFDFCNLTLNFEIFTRDVKASCALIGADFTNICGSISKKKCYINISMAKARWHTSFFGSTLIVPFNIFVSDVVHRTNSFCSCLNMVFA